MKNIISYAAEQSDSFREKPLNAVDSLVLSQLSYLHFDGFVPGISDTAEAVSIAEIARKENTGTLFRGVRDRENNRKLFNALANSPRFRDIRMTYYVNKIDLNEEKQFSAVTYLLDDGTAYVAYRGTDATFVGWKEDFNMGFISPVPSQQEGVKYLNTVGYLAARELYVGGHSKGGNIAVYSAIKCHQHIRDSIIRVYNHDGPGFREEIFHCHGFLSIKDRIHKTIPQSSVIGMLLHNQENYYVVKSNRFWIMQNDPFSWLVVDGDFSYLRTVKNSTMFMNTTLNKWIGSLDDNNRELFADTLYKVIRATGDTSFYDLTDDWYNKAAAVLKAVKGIDEETKTFVLKTLSSLFVLAAKNLQESTQEFIENIQRKGRKGIKGFYE